MKRVLAVVLIAALATLALGIDDTVSAIQSGDQKKADTQRADVAKALAGMQRGTTATVENKYGMKFDVVIEEITADSVTVLRQIGDTTTSETIPISDIARIKKKSLKKMGTASKVLIVAAVTLGVLFVAALTTCSVSGESASADANVSPANASVGADAR
ncbi:hypothetical protein LuPra_02440 [Luteitalea pratensis]|uniref:PepSY domain-containing protein n=1 Tax=Luteitalea pratensis TaxID=1855912 RepID=A0A143PKZ9_LUTPR|nr:hypothetical protein [Luteitalea pratensis]AMY09227.1 hypothetical protein LuPra_02440 [Luteitalea pratensis]